MKVPENHFELNYPGLITNEEDVLEKDAEQQNLYGTGNVKGMDLDYIDRYVDQQYHAN